MNFLKFITKKIYLFIFSLFLSFGFITTSYATDITIWDLSGRNGQDEFYDNLNKEYKKINPDVNKIIGIKLTLFFSTKTLSELPEI